MRLFLAGDVMTGRGIDQILDHPGDPTLHEGWVRSATEYVRIAERANGEIPRPAEPAYIWGEALDIIDDRRVEARIINLETAVTRVGEPWPQKGIHYRMHPKNIGCLTVAGVDCCVLANNHVLDWSYEGLTQTLATLEDAGLAVAGAGLDSDSAWSPAVIETASGGRILVVGVGMTSSGVPRDWNASPDSPGLALVTAPLSESVGRIAETVANLRREGDLVVVSVHWGSNWGYDVPSTHRDLARALIDQAGADVIHGHSSHHPMGIEVYRDRPILYGCGDLINDYEGIGGHEEYRSDLRALYFVEVDPIDGMGGLELVPVRTERFRLVRATAEETGWLGRRLGEECRRLGTRLSAAEGLLRLEW